MPSPAIRSVEVVNRIPGEKADKIWEPKRYPHDPIWFINFVDIWNLIPTCSDWHFYRMKIENLIAFSGSCERWIDQNRIVGDSQKINILATFLKCSELIADFTLLEKPGPFKGIANLQKRIRKLIERDREV